MTSREKFLSDILTTCVEGGSGYWTCTIQDVQRGEDLRVTSALFEEDLEVLGSRQHQVDLRTIEAGLALARDRRVQLGREVRKAILHADVTEEADLDAVEADAVLQLGLFGEVVYG